MKPNVAIETSTFSNPSRSAGNVRSDQSNAAKNTSPFDRENTSRDSFKVHLDRQAKLEDQKKLEHSQNHDEQNSRTQENHAGRSEVVSNQPEPMDKPTDENQSIESKSSELEDTAIKLVDDTGLDVPNDANNIDLELAGIKVLGAVSDELNLSDPERSKMSIDMANVNAAGSSIDIPLSQYLQSGGVGVLASPGEANASINPLVPSGELPLLAGLRGNVNHFGSAISMRASGLTPANESANALADASQGQLLTNASTVNSNGPMSASVLQNMSANNNLVSTKPDFLNNSLDGDLLPNSNKTGSISLLDTAVVGAKTSETSLSDLASSSLDKSSSFPLLKTAAESVMASANTRVQMPATMTFSQPGWAGMIADRTAMMASQKIEVADIQLDPPELGPLQIKVHVQNEQTTVSFVSGSQAVRESLEQASHRLKDMLEEQGLNLVDVDVSDRENQDEDQPSGSLDGAKDQNEENNGLDDQLAETNDGVSIKLKSGIDDFV